MAETSCRFFNGYKPCGKNIECDRSKCGSFASVQHRVLIVHLEALGAVLRSTSLVAAVRREFPRAHITWITKAPAQHLIKGVVDRVLTLSTDDLLALSALTFDVALVIDKSLTAAGILKHTSVTEVRGFRADSFTGAIVPANSEAKELWGLGLSDHKKFYENQKSEQQLVHESLKLGAYTHDEYVVELSRAEKDLAAARRAQWSPEGKPVIGINTGCSPTLPAKKLTIEGHLELIRRLRANGNPIVLLGGPEDTERNEAIAKACQVHASSVNFAPVIASPTTLGLRDGFASVAACDMVFTGDSLGMHMAIGLQKWVVAWFGPSCAQEIELYGRGVKIMTKAPCSPCWKRDCEKPVMCYDQVDFDQCVRALAQGIEWLTSSSKLHSPGTSFSLSP